MTGSPVEPRRLMPIERSVVVASLPLVCCALLIPVLPWMGGGAPGAPALAEAAEAPRRARPARHRRRRKSHRGRKRGRRKRAAPKAAPAPESLRWVPKTRRLAPGRWRPEVAYALERLLEFEGEGTPGYTPNVPPVAVFSWEDVAITHDVGEAVFLRMVRRAEFKFSDEFWKLIPEQYGRARIRIGYERFVDRLAALNEAGALAEQDALVRREARAKARKLPMGPERETRLETLAEEGARAEEARAERNLKRLSILEPLAASDPAYRMYRKAFAGCYQSICREVGRRACAEWLVKLLSGFTEEKLRDYTLTTLREELRRPVGTEDLGEAIGDPVPVRVRTGLRLIPEMRDLFQKLKDKGFDVWVISSTNDWSLKASVDSYGVHISRAVGVRSRVIEGRLTLKILRPTPSGTGKAEAVTMFIGAEPALVMAGPGEESLLDYGRGVRVMIADKGSDTSEWTRRHWLFQPRLSPVRAPQKLD